MQIILLHPRFIRAKSVTLNQTHLIALGFLLMVLILTTSLLLCNAIVHFAGGKKIPFLPDLQAPVTQDDSNKQDKFLKENLAVMAIKLGEMQAQLMRLDALGERVQGLAGVKPEEFNFKVMPGRGGTESSSLPEATLAPMSISAFQQALDAMAQDVEHRADYMNVIESTLMTDKMRSKQLPTIQPVNVTYNASSFGWRLDPFTGRNAFHEGMDFPAQAGTPIVAAAGGVVIAAEFHSQYGNMLEIDHGNDIMTRYAHASRLLVKVGDIVKRGQQVADIGSTGRSTGAHLHFEVHVKGVVQNPLKFLSAGADQAKLAELIKN
ncbi:MAG: M23 family metallopeptidase [Pseudomonadota bacterium]